MAANEEIIEIPEEEVQIEEFGGDADDKKGIGTFIGVVGVSALLGALGHWAFGKIKTAIKNAQIAAYEKRKEREAEIEEELAKRSQEEESPADDETSED